MTTLRDHILLGFRGIYEMPEAARYLTVTLRRDVPSLEAIHLVRSAKLIRWIRAGLTLPDLAKLPGRGLAITFEDLVSMRVIAILRTLRLSWPKIHRAEAWLRQATGYERPFAVKQLWTETSEIFADFPVGLIAASQGGQLAFAALLGSYIEPIGDLTFKPHNGVHVAATWMAYEDILIDPEIQFGEPCIKGTRIPTSSIWSMWKGGDSFELLAKNFQLSSQQIEHALGWEGHLRATKTPTLSRG